MFKSNVTRPPIVEIECPHCGIPLIVSEQNAGRTVWCRQCKRQVPVPTLGIPESPTDSSSINLPPASTHTALSRSELADELETKNQVIEQLNTDLGIARSSSEHFARIAEDLKTKIAAHQTNSAGNADQPDLAFLVAQVRAQQSLLAEKEERIQQLMDALNDALRGQSIAPVLTEDSIDMHRMQIAIEEARYTADQRADEIDALRSALVDKADLLERTNADLRSAVARTQELKRENERLSAELSALREEYHSHVVQAEAAERALTAAAVRAATQEPRLHQPQAQTTEMQPRAPEEFEALIEKEPEMKGDQRVLVDSLLKFMGRR